MEHFVIKLGAGSFELGVTKEELVLSINLKYSSMSYITLLQMLPEVKTSNYSSISF